MVKLATPFHVTPTCHSSVCHTSIANYPRKGAFVSSCSLPLKWVSLALKGASSFVYLCFHALKRRYNALRLWISRLDGDSVIGHHNYLFDKCAN